MTVRWAGAGDAPALRALNEAFNGEGTSTEAQIEASLCANPCERVAVCDAGGALVGFLCAQVVWSMCYQSPVAQFSELYVDPAHRRRGVAEALMRFAESALRAEGIAEFWLLTGRENVRAQALYRKLGYARSGELHFAKGD